MAAGPAAPTRACCCRPRPIPAPMSAWRSARMPSASSARPRKASPGRAGWPSNRCSPTSIPPWSSCSTSRRRAVWRRRTRRRARRLSVSINASSAQAVQASLSSPFGFADFLSGDAAVRVARPVAVAETADGPQRPDRHRAAAPGRPGQSVAHLLSGRRSHRARSTACIRAMPAIRRRCRARAYQMTSGGTSIGGPGYGNYEQTGPAARERGRPRRHAAHQQHPRQHLLGLRPGQRDGERPACRPSVELRPEHLGLGRHLWRRRSRLQRPDRAARLHQRRRAMAGSPRRAPA